MVFDPTIFEEIEASLEALDIDEIKQRLEPLTIGFQTQTPLFEPGTFLYRARRLGPMFPKEGISLPDLIYPPAAICTAGRLNRQGQSVFYAGMGKEGPFFELPGLAAGDEVILTYWKTTKRMLVNNIGYTQYAFEQLGATRPVPNWQPQEGGPESAERAIPLVTLPEEAAEKAMAVDDARDLKQTLSKYFTRQVNADEAYRYKLTTAIGELHLGEIANHEIKFAGILYPSVRMRADGDNLALQPWFVDNHLEFRKAVHVRIKENSGMLMQTDFVDAAHGFDGEGKLEWLGRLKNWTLEPFQHATLVFTAGVDEDGDYRIAQGGEPAHWICTDVKTGKTIEAA
jgi:hypothetical protein